MCHGTPLNSMNVNTTRHPIPYLLQSIHHLNTPSKSLFKTLSYIPAIPVCPLPKKNTAIFKLFPKPFHQTRIIQKQRLCNKIYPLPGNNYFNICKKHIPGHYSTGNIFKLITAFHIIEPVLTSHFMAAMVIIILGIIVFIRQDIEY